MNQYEFDKLLEKYLRGACSPEEELLLDEWSNRQMSHETNVLSEEETSVVKKQLWRRIKQTNFPNYPLSIKWFSWVRLSMAASLFFVFSMGILWFYNTKNVPSKGELKSELKGVEMTNTTDKPQNITLNDGSTVNLQPNSTITFPEKFGDHNRIVYLKGEGFFKVKRDTTKPFYVYAGQLVTEVLGTSFTVKSYQEDKIAEVIVVSGKVMVYNTAHTEGVVKKETERTILTPNQKVVFENKTQALKSEVVEKPVALNPPKTPESFVFEEVNVFDVLKKLEKIYGLTITPSPNLKDCIFTGDLNDLDLFTQLNLICKTINAQYEKKETRIFINGEGCN